MTTAAIFISSIGILISILSYLNSRKKIRFDIHSFKREQYVAVEKLNDLLEILKDLKNTNPKISKEFLESDCELIKKFLEYYSSNEEKLIKSDYTLISRISSIRSILISLEESLRWIDTTSSKGEYIYKFQIANYKRLFLMLYIISLSLNDGHQEHKKYWAGHSKFFLNLYEEFEGFNDPLLISYLNKDS